MKNSPEELEEMIRHLQTRIVCLEVRVAQLESGRNPAQPIWPMPPQNLPPQMQPSVRCVKCGMVWKGVMGYVCGDTYCPVQLKTTC
jgi:hypothetical protein